MMRCGKSLGTLDWNTDIIYLIGSKQDKNQGLEDNQDFLDKVKKGEFIVK